jgi:ubiquinone/menaquinone biosynthesis C-methylase UbiE
MKLNTLEFAAMNNPIRGFIQGRYEVKKLRNISSLGRIEIALEIGCGNGNGARVIKRNFSPERIIAIDLDEKMIRIAKKRNRDESISFIAMDASRLDFPDNYFDAVFDFGIIHHIPNWQDCLQEIYRVLKHNGEVVIEDLSIESFTTGVSKLWKRCLVHPYKEMYSTRQFKEYLTETGFDVQHYSESNPMGLVKHFFLTAVKE